MRNQPHRRLPRPPRPPPAQPRRRPTGQRRPLPDRHRQTPIPPTHQGLHATPTQRRTNQTRNHPLPKTLRSQRNRHPPHQTTTTSQSRLTSIGASQHSLRSLGGETAHFVHGGGKEFPPA